MISLNMLRPIFSLFLLLTFLFATAALPDNASAQVRQGSKPNGDGATDIWAQTMGIYNTIGTGYGAKFVVDLNRHQFLIRGIRANSKDFDDHTWELGLLYSRRKMMGDWLLSGGTGVAMVGGSRFSNVWGTRGAEQMNTMIGFPLEAELAWSPVTFFAVGIYTYANVNTGQPIGGVGLSVRVGKVR